MSTIVARMVVHPDENTPPNQLDNDSTVLRLIAKQAKPSAAVALLVY
jgi:hypothetical protein